MLDATAILSSISASAAVSALIVLISKTWISEHIKNLIKHEYDTKLVSFKIELKAENDSKLEQLRSQLRIVASERQIQYQRLHEEVADTVAKTYGHLQTIYDLIDVYVSDFGYTPYPSDAEFEKQVYKAISEFRTYYRPRRIYLTRDLAKKIDDFDKQLLSTFRKQVRLNQAGQGMDAAKLIERMKKIEKTMKHEMPEIYKQLEDKFRQLLGAAN